MTYNVLSIHHSPPTRRRFLIEGIALAGVSVPLSVKRAVATPESMRAAIRNVIGGATVRKGKVKVDLPALVESGNAVPIAISVESAMTSTDYVKAIYVFNERNPQPSVVGVQLG